MGSSAASTSSDLAKGKNFLQKLLYVQHVDQEKDTVSETPDRYLEEYLIADRNIFPDSNFTEYLKSPKENLSILKSSMKDRITKVTVYSNPLPIPLPENDVTIHAFLVFKTKNYLNGCLKEEWWSLEQNGTYIVLQQSPNKDDVIQKIYTETKTFVKRLQPIKKQKTDSTSNFFCDLMRIVVDAYKLNEPYHLLYSNCQNFATFVFEKLNDGREKWSTMTSAIVNQIGLKKKEIQPKNKVNALKYGSILKDDKFDCYWAMMEGRRKHFEELINNLTIESLNSVDSQGYTLLEWAKVFSSSDWPIEKELKKKCAEIQSDETLFLRNVFFIALQYLPPNKKLFDSFNGIDINGMNKTGDTALHLALYGGKWKIADEILRKCEDSDVNSTNSLGDTPLLLAAKLKCEIGLFKIILSRTNSEKVNKVNGNGWTALHYAIKNKSKTKVEELLKRKDVDVNIKNNEEKITALHSAILWKHIPIDLFKKILEKSTDINAQDENGDTALHLAIIRQSEIATKKLLAHKDVDVNIKNNIKRTPLHLASKWWKDIPIDLFNLILEKSTDINAQDNNGGTALHYAILGESEIATKGLLKHSDVDVNVTNNDKETALHLASKWEDFPSDLFYLILENSTVINAQNKDGGTALHLAIRTKSEIATKKLLAHKDVDVNVKDNNSCTPLHWVCLLWKEIPVDLLNCILEKSDINAQDEGGCTALHYAILRKSETEVKELLNHREVDINIKDKYNRTPIHLASKWKDIPSDVFKIILEKSTDVNAQDKDGNTALHYAFFQNSQGAIKVLLKDEYDHVMDVNVRNHENRTPLHCATICKDISTDLYKKILQKSTSDTVKAQDKDGNTALHLAIMFRFESSNEFKVNELLTDVRVNVDIKNNVLDTALSLASRWTNIPSDLFKNILEKSTDVNAKDKDGNSPLHIAILSHSETGVMELLKHKSTDVNAQDATGNTPLHIGILRESETGVRELLNHTDVNVNMKNNKNETALQCAASSWKNIPEDLLKIFEEKSDNQIKTITIDKSAILGMGSYSTVFKGAFNGEQVAVKRIDLNRVELIQREVEIIKCLDHPNVIKLLGVQNDDDFRYYAFELAAGSLYHFCQGHYIGKMPSDGEALKQMAKGLEYIHSLKFVHRDIKPSNILISMNEPINLMIADFGFCKATTDSRTYSMGSGNKGTEDWMAPEILNCYDDDDDDDEIVKRFSISSDTWALGCVFFYFLTRGIHPFGKNLKKIRYNMLVKERPSIEFENIALQSSSKEMVEVYQLISNMIQVEPRIRIALEYVIEKLERVYPSDSSSNQLLAFNKTTNETSTNPTEPIETTGEGQINQQTSQRTEKDNASDNLNEGNAYRASKNEGETTGPSISGDGHDNQDNTEMSEIPIRCHCLYCKNKIANLDENCKALRNEAKIANCEIDTVKESLKDNIATVKSLNATVNSKVGAINKSLGHLNESQGHVNESLMRTNLDSNVVGKIRNISSLFQLIKCYGEAKYHKWTDEDTNEKCKLVKRHIEKNINKDFYCSWYQEQALIWLDKQKSAVKRDEREKDKETLRKTSNPTQDLINIYNKYKLKHYIPADFFLEEFTKPNSPIFLLVLYESIRHVTSLLSFPPPGILTMDVPVKISFGISNQNESKCSECRKPRNVIEIGEIKSSIKGENDAKIQLQRSLFCFKWLDQVISQVDTSYILIGNIYINDNSSEAQTIPESKKKKKQDFQNGITFQTTYEEYN